MANNTEQLRYDINKLLSSMQVEEYGIKPQREVLDEIMQKIEAEATRREQAAYKRGYIQGGLDSQEKANG